MVTRSFSVILQPAASSLLPLLLKIAPPPGVDLMTWKSSADIWHRIDYVLLPMAWRHLGQMTWVEPCHAIVGRKIDHLAVLCDACGATDKCRDVPMLRGLPFDVHALNNPEARAAFAMKLAQIQLPAWEIDVNTHLDMVNGAIVEAAIACFPKTRRVPLGHRGCLRLRCKCISVVPE